MRFAYVRFFSFFKRKRLRTARGYTKNASSKHSKPANGGFYTPSADLRRSELHRRPRLEPSDIFVHLYRISTEHNSNDAKRLFLRIFPAYPEIISHSIWASSRGEKGEF